MPRTERVVPHSRWTSKTRESTEGTAYKSPIFLTFIVSILLLFGPARDVSGAANDEKRIDPEIIVADSGSSIVAEDISYSTIQGLCGDGDGCILRLAMTNQFGQQMDTRYFVINDDDSWRADINGGGMATTGDASDFDNEFVFTLGTNPYCRLEDNTEFDFIIIKKFLLSGEDLSVTPMPLACVLRVED